MIACFMYCTAMYRGYIISHCDIFVNSVAGICRRHAEGIGPPPAKRRRPYAKSKVGFADSFSAAGFVDITEISNTIFPA